MARDLAAQSHRVSYGDEKYMDRTSKSFYIHCSAKRDLPDGKWIFTYPGAKSLAMVVFISDGNWNGMQYRYREDGSLSVIETYKNGKRDGENRGYYKNGQMHFKAFYLRGECIGDFFAFDSLGNVTRHETHPVDSIMVYRKAFVPINIADILKLYSPNSYSDTAYSIDSLEWVKRVSIDDVSIYSIQATSVTTHNDNRKVFIGQYRDSLLNNFGTDYYIMTEQYVDYVIDAQNKTLNRLSDIPSFLLRCYFDNDVVNQIVIINNQAKTYCQIVTLLKEFFNHN